MPLLEQGWVTDQCLLSFSELFGLLQKAEILATSSRGEKGLVM